MKVSSIGFQRKGKYDEVCGIDIALQDNEFPRSAAYMIKTLGSYVRLLL